MTPVSKVLQVARHEFVSLWREGRLRVGALVGSGMLLGLALLSWQTWRAEDASRRSFETSQREQWEEQGEKHPHRAAHFGFYLIKPELPLALFDSGVKPVTGQTLWLEAHTRSSFSFAPLEDAGAAAALGLTNAAEALQLLGPLFVLVAAYGSVAREREDGTLRLILAQGLSPRLWFLGKYLGLGAGLLLVAVPLAAGLLALSYLASTDSWNLDTVARSGVLLLAHLVYLSIWLALALSASTWARTGRQALAGLLAFWILGGVLAPRVASFVAEQREPTPSVADWKHDQAEAFENGLGAEAGWSKQLAELERTTKDQYGVDTLEELPVGFSGLRMLAMNGFTDRISDYYQEELEAVYAAQEGWRLGMSVMGPYLPMRVISQSMAGMDWRHYLRFADAGEAYRRSVVRELDQLLGERLTGNRWEIGFDRDVWETVPEFEYEEATLAWSTRAAVGGFAALGGWVLISIVLALLATRRIRP